MFKMIRKALHHVRSVVGSSSKQNDNLYFLQIHPFSLSSLKPIQKSTNQHSFTVDYLITSFGFSPETALSTSKYVKFEAPDKPDSVQAFFESHGFTKNQITTLVRSHPSVLVSDPEKTLLPKLEFLKSKGLSSADIATILTNHPYTLKRSLEKQIIPLFNLFNDVFQSQVKATVAIRHLSGLLSCTFETHVARVKALQEVGVPNANIAILFSRKAAIEFRMSTDNFRQTVEEVQKMGINPLRVNFVDAVQILGQMTKSTWDRKIEVYKKWGLSENEILVAFRKQARCMMKSEDKINEVMDFIVNKMGQQDCFVKVPTVVSMSLKKRIVPRCVVYQVLLSRGLVKANHMSLVTLLSRPEKWFLQKVVNRHKEEAPELLKLYKEKLDLAK